MNTILMFLNSTIRIKCLIALVIQLLIVGCGDGRAGIPKNESKITDAVHNFDPNTFEKPAFNGVDLYTGPYRTPKNLKGLTIHGYNYTDTYIDSFTVNGVGGGNLEVSEGINGGGVGTCCASVLADIPLPLTVEIAWNREREKPTCKQTVLLSGPVPEDANDFEVHFYLDGTIQVAITSYPSAARLVLPRFNRIQRKADGNVNNDEKLSVCESDP